LVLRVLAIGDLANNIATLRKFTKSSQIHLINFDWEGNSKTMDERKGIEFFKSTKMKDYLKKIHEIKDEFDICLAMSPTGLLVSFLSDLNYIAYFVGHDIRSPPFLKGVKDPLSTEQTLYHFNFLERQYYKKAYESAITCVATDEELFVILKKFRKDANRITGYIEDTTIFNENVSPINIQKTKFTFFSPARMGLQKGTDKIWKALKLCKSDFKVLQVKWFDQRTPEELELASDWIKNKPPQVEFISPMKREDVAKYFSFADAVIGQVSGLQGSVERQASLCKKTVIHYANPKFKYMINNEMVTAPFVPNSAEPEEIARTIDKVVESNEFREKLADEGYEFVKKLSDPYFIAKQWEELFEKIVSENKTIRKNSNKIKLWILIKMYFIANRLYFRKMKKIIQKLFSV